MGRSRSRSRSRSRNGGRVDVDRVQELVDERQAARRDRNFDEADKIREELNDLQIRVNDTDLTWHGPDGSSGQINNPGGKGPGKGFERRDGDWDCPDCGKLVFASKDKCFSCGCSKPRGGSRGYDDRGRGSRDDRDDRGGRRGDRYDDYDDRRGGRGGRDDYGDRRGRRDRYPSEDSRDDRGRRDDRRRR
mmetsp:Transcript_1616/g.2706  ORF Transcript_1616/g.2706 Transcript_1616/m.2706 type:complete len:190 (-) Transcript_1616:84-653(-)